MPRNYIPGDPILLDLQAEQDKSNSQAEFMAGGHNFDPPGRRQGSKSPGEMVLIN